MNLWTHLQLAQPNGLQVAQHARDFLRLTLGTPFPPPTRTQPIGQKAQPNMIHHSVGPAVKNGADFPVALEFAESLLTSSNPL